MPLSKTEPAWWSFAAIGLIAGLFSGFFGVGGGIVMVPLLVSLLSRDHKTATVMSLAAIIPAATVGALGFVASQSVPIDQLVFGVVIAVGGIVTAPLGTRALRKFNVGDIRWAFVAVLVGTAIMVFVTLPSRDVLLEWSFGTVAELFLLGCVMGFVAGLLGVGGGLIAVPVLIVLFGVSDLNAKALSLVAMIPAAISGTLSTARVISFPVKPSIALGAGAATTSLAGVWLATIVPVAAAQALLAVFIGYAAVTMALRAYRSGRS